MDGALSSLLALRGGGDAWLLASAAGVRIGGLTLGLQVVAVDEHLVQPVEPTAHACVVALEGRCRSGLVWRESALDSWWTRHEQGFEQGFTLHAPHPGQTVVEIRVDGGHVSPHPDGGLRLIDATGRFVLYEKARAWDATGRPLLVSLLGDGHTIRLEVDTTDAVAPVTIDPVLHTTTWSWLPPGITELSQVDDVGDVDGDGYSDLLVGYPALLVMGGPDHYDTTRVIDIPYDRVQRIGDVDGDGDIELYVTDHVLDVLPGDLLHTMVSFQIAASPQRFTREEIGDLDGDGFDDIARAASGMLDIHLGGPAGPASVPDISVADIPGQLTGVGDADGDGLAEIFALHGPSGGQWFALAGGSMQPIAQNYWSISLFSYIAGQQLQGGGDLDGDGHPDALVSTFGALGWPSYDHATQMQLVTLSGTTQIRDTRSGPSQLLQIVGDVDDDGLHEFVIGSRYANEAVDRTRTLRTWHPSTSILSYVDLSTTPAQRAVMGRSPAQASDGYTYPPRGFDLDVGDDYVQVLRVAPERDLDGDGLIGDHDCEPLVPSGPAVPEIPYNGIDEDCDGFDLVDVDGDGADGAAVGGPDCDDNQPAVAPGHPERAGDGLDNDCDPSNDDDLDLDGFLARIAGGDDCDDLDDTIYPGAPDVPGDGIDADCDGGDGLVLRMGPVQAGAPVVVEVSEARPRAPVSLHWRRLYPHQAATEILMGHTDAGGHLSATVQMPRGELGFVEFTATQGKGASLPLERLVRPEPCAPPALVVLPRTEPGTLYVDGLQWMGGDLDLDHWPDRWITEEDATRLIGISRGEVFATLELGPTWQSRRVEVADVDGDGLDDLLFTTQLVGDTSQDPETFDTWIFLGPIEGTLSPEVANHRILGADSATPVGDLDGDGFVDLVVTMRDLYWRSRPRVLPGPLDPHNHYDTGHVLVHNLGAVTLRATGVPDLSGDGLPDIVLSTDFATVPPAVEITTWPQGAFRRPVDASILSATGASMLLGGRTSAGEYRMYGFRGPLSTVDPSTATFAMRQSTPRHFPDAIRQLDLDGDGRLDLLVLVHTASSGVLPKVHHIYDVWSAGAFHLEAQPSTMNLPSSPYTASTMWAPYDIDGDGTQEIYLSWSDADGLITAGRCP